MQLILILGSELWMYSNDSSTTVDRVKADWILTIENGDHFYITFQIEVVRGTRKIDLNLREKPNQKVLS